MLERGGWYGRHGFSLERGVRLALFLDRGRSGSAEGLGGTGDIEVSLERGVRCLESERHSRARALVWETAGGWAFRSSVV